MQPIARGLNLQYIVESGSTARSTLCAPGWGGCEATGWIMRSAPGMAHPLAYYAKVSAACFAVGAAMETFMIHTGFYEK